MDLPKNARVVVVDNKYDEVKDLLAALAKDGVATLYYSGAQAFPDTPLAGVRLLFLDLELDGLRGQPDKMKASAAVANVSKLIAKDNGPLIVVLWTQHDNLEQLVKTNLEKASAIPLIVVCIAKEDCVNDGGKFDAKCIHQEIGEKLKLAGVIGLYVAWENAVFCGSTRLADRFSKLVSVGDDWALTISRVFYLLNEANSGDAPIGGVKNQFLSACESYGSGLIREINFCLRKLNFGLGNLKLQKKPLSAPTDEEIAAKVNAFLFYDYESANLLGPGTVLAVKSKSKHLNLLKGIAVDFYKTKKTIDADIKKIIASNKVTLCKVVITPPCDSAQRKEFRSTCLFEKNRKFDHVVWAIMVEHDGSFEVHGGMSRCYKEIVNFEYGTKRYDLLIDLDTVGLEVLEGSRRSYKRLFTLKPLIVADIQSKAANQLNRIGICAVK